MNAADFDRLAVRGHRAAELLAGYGDTATRRTRHTNTPLRGTSYDRERHQRHDLYRETDGQGGWVDHLAPVPNDPTGETAIATSNTGRTLIAMRLTDAIADYDHAIAALTEMLLTLAPEARDDATTPKVEPCDTNGPGAGWCRSCWRDEKHMEPEHTHSDGRVKHRGACAWCATFEAEYKTRPPLPLLRLRHQGRRITVDMVAAHIKKEVR